MSTATTKYLGQLRTACTHSQSNTEIITDAPTDNHGKGEAFSPTDLLSTSLASCMITTMGIAAQKQGIPFEKANAEMTKVMASDPRRVAKIIINLQMPQNISEDHRRFFENVALNCPVAKSLHPDIVQEIKFEYT